MGEELDDKGLSWKERAELAEETIQEAITAGRVGAWTVLLGHGQQLSHMRELVSLQPYMAEAKARIEAEVAASGAGGYHITRIVDVAREIAKERKAAGSSVAAT